MIRYDVWAALPGWGDSYGPVEGHGSVPREVAADWRCLAVVTRRLCLLLDIAHLAGDRPRTNWSTRRVNENDKKIKNKRMEVKKKFPK